MDPTHSSDYLNGELTGSIVGAIATRDSISPVRNSGGSPPIPFFHNAGLEPNKSVIGNSRSLPPELDLLSGSFEAQANRTTVALNNSTMPTLETLAPRFFIVHGSAKMLDEEEIE